MATPAANGRPLANRRLRRDVVSALRGGAVPSDGLHLYATGMSRFERVIDEELADVAAGRSHFKAVRAPYGGGKTFFSRWLQARALDQGFAVTEVQVSAVDTPLYQLQTVYRRAMERLSTGRGDSGAFRTVVDGWLYTLEEEVRAAGKLNDGASDAEVDREVGEALEHRLKDLSAQNATFAAVLRAYHRATIADDEETAEGLIAFVSGDPTISSAIKRKANMAGKIDNRMALNCLHGLSLVLRNSGRKGLVLVLDEVETIQRQRPDSLEKSLHGLRQLVDELLGGKIPGIYLLITGTPEFFDSPWGVQRLEPLKQRLHTEFGPDGRFDNQRAVQIRLPSFDAERLLEVGRLVRDIYPAEDEERLRATVSDAFLGGLVDTLVGAFNGQVTVAPRIFLRKLVDVMDRVNDYPEFDPVTHYKLEVGEDELNEDERSVLSSSPTPRGAARTPDDVELEVDLT